MKEKANPVCQWDNTIGICRGVTKHSSLPSDVRDHESQNCSQQRYDSGFAIERRQTPLNGADCRC